MGKSKKKDKKTKKEKKMPSIHIELDNPHRSYFAGQAVDGRVVVTNNKQKPKKTKELSVVLEGRGRVYWTETETYTTYTTVTVNGRTERRPVTRTRVISYSAEESYAYYKLVLAGDGVNFIELPEGTTTYMFRFILPANLPSSFTSSTGQVTYALKAEAKKSLLKINDRTIVPFTVNGIFDLNLNLQACMPQECRKLKGSNFFACRKGQLGFVLTLPQRSGFVPGETLDFNAEISNSSNRKVIGVKAHLYQVTSFHAQGRTKTVSKIVTEVKGPEVDRGDDEMWSPGTLVIPALPPTKLGGQCRIIDVQYFLYFEMKISGISSSLHGKLPIAIGNIPLTSTFLEFQPGPTVPGMGMVMPQPQPGPSTGQPQMGFVLTPVETKIPEPMPSTSTAPPISEKSPYMAGASDSNPAPSAPIFNDYPDLPPPSYAEAVGTEGFVWNPEANPPGENGNGEDANEDTSSPSAPPIDDFVPNYITYNRKA